MNAGNEPIDVVYTWVDDSFSGYHEQLQAHAGDKRDTNPNRTRDNLDLLRFSLRSLARNVPFIRRVFILSCRPQVPAWLNTSNPQLTVVHHDAIMDPDMLPTFNSFAIVSHLHRLPGLSQRFLYLEDDMLVPRPLALADLLAPDGRPYVFLRGARTIPHEQLDPAKASPWNLALASADRALSAAFGVRRRNHVIHGPRLIEQDSFAALIERFRQGFAHTRASRFRADGNLPSEYLYPHYLLETGGAVLAPKALARKMEGYASLENWTAWTWAQLKVLELRRPRTINLNDSFGDRPNHAAVRLVQSKLRKWFPDASPFERAEAGT